MNVIIYHNNDHANVYHKPGEFDPTTLDLTEIVRCEIHGTDIHEVLEIAFDKFNYQYGPEDDAVRQYKEKGERVLSVGDVVQVDDRKFICLWIGWQEY